MPVDFGKTVEDYRRHRPSYPEELFERLVRIGIGDTGQRVLDIGTGLGYLARGLARRGCEVVGIDASETLLAEARAIDDAEGLRLHYVAVSAERTMLDERSFDVVSAGQCWHWFDAHKVIREIKRVLRPRGWLAIVHFDWIPLKGNAIAATEELIEKYNPEWTMGGGTGLHPRWLTDVRSAGFTDVQTFSFDIAMPFTHEGWRGRVRASAGVKASLSPDMVARFDEQLRRRLEADFPDEPMSLPHCVWALTCRAPG
jgi:SAM-dependent methyltransferase